MDVAVIVDAVAAAEAAELVGIAHFEEKLEAWTVFSVHACRPVASVLVAVANAAHSIAAAD